MTHERKDDRWIPRAKIGSEFSEPAVHFGPGARPMRSPRALLTENYFGADEIAAGRRASLLRERNNVLSG